jgi:hypothetical protein
MLYRTTPFDLTTRCLVESPLTQYCTRKLIGQCFNEAHLGVSILLGRGSAPFPFRWPSMESSVAHIQVSHFSVVVTVSLWFIIRRCRCARLYYVERCGDWWMMNCEGCARRRLSPNWCILLPFGWRYWGKPCPPPSQGGRCASRD